MQSNFAYWLYGVSFTIACVGVYYNRNEKVKWENRSDKMKYVHKFEIISRIHVEQTYIAS